MLAMLHLHTVVEPVRVRAGSVVNQIQRTYNGFGQMLIDYQANDGAVNTSTTPNVQYG